MELLWSERQPNMFTGKVRRFMELLGGGTWAMGEGFDYFIEPLPDGGYMLDQTLVESNGFAVVRHSFRCGDKAVDELQALAQEWEGQRAE